MTTTDTERERELERALSSVEDPLCDDENVVSLGLVDEIRVDDDTAKITLTFNTPYAPGEMELGDRIREAVADLGLEPDLRASADGIPGYENDLLPGVRNVIAVASGKGGVGKTTVAANLAKGLHELGARVGILDADVHGPNLPRILPTEGEPGATPNGEIVPPRSDGVMVMSTAHLLPDGDEPAILRGPMVNNVMMKFIQEVEWGRLDYLVVDLPPGTGDASLNLLQSMPVTGAVIVTTPQQMAVDDARKGLRLFDQHDTPILGVVENMSTFRCPTCDDEHGLFGRHGGDGISEDYDVPIIGRLPLHPDFGADGTEAPVVTDDDSPVQPVVEELVGDVADRVAEVNHRAVADATPDVDEERVPTGAESPR